jgi:UDP-N-acetylmuramyl pentapeptide phosphotransferase/UDP-N-acetylglucosamine-1-phosphate transferase
MGFEYLVFMIIMALLETVYLHLAPAMGIFDKPNSRSSHMRDTIRGGGIIFWFAALAYLIYSSGDQGYFFAGATIIAVASFVDDIKPMHQLPRFLMHFGAMTTIYISSGLFGFLPWYLIIISYIVFIGILNAYNFMDGINGITGMHSISVLLALQYINVNLYPFTEPAFIWLPVLANLVFLLFNFRKKALCFAGDVGSVTMAFWIVYLLLLAMMKSGSVVWILLLSVYGSDTVLTILHRLYLRQNIFAAHRMHFYQALANEKAIDHRIISVGYAIVQGIISCIVIWQRNLSLYILIPLIIIPLCFIYLYKFQIINSSSLLLCKNKMTSVEN